MRDRHACVHEHFETMEFEIEPLGLTTLPLRSGLRLFKGCSANAYLPRGPYL
jgi:hypothetical protein